MKLTCQNIKKSFYDNDGNRKQVLSGISFEAGQGSLVMLKGVSGCGKSTLMNIISGLLLPDEGSVKADDKCINTMSETKRDQYRMKHIGYVFQTFNLLSPVTVLDNVMLPAILGGTSGNENRALRILDSLALKEHAGKYPYQLSVGQRQRVAVARVLFMEPPVILADEPTASLDNVSAQAVKTAIADLKERGACVLLASHDQIFADIIPDHTIYLDGGSHEKI